MGRGILFNAGTDAAFILTESQARAYMKMMGKSDAEVDAFFREIGIDATRATESEGAE